VHEELEEKYSNIKSKDALNLKNEEKISLKLRNNQRRLKMPKRNVATKNGLSIKRKLIERQANSVSGKWLSKWKRISICKFKRLNYLI
jgi:hypothetical protein